MLQIKAFFQTKVNGAQRGANKLEPPGILNINLPTTHLT